MYQFNACCGRVVLQAALQRRFNRKSNRESWIRTSQFRRYQTKIFFRLIIFAYGRASGRKADYAEGYKAGYAKAMADAKAGQPA